MAKYQLLAFTNPVAGREEEFNRWYQEQHIPDLLAVPGFVSAQRYELTDATGSDNPGWTSLAVYELECDDPDALMAQVRSRLGTAAMPVSDSLEPGTFKGLIARAIATRLFSKSA
jgi:hypothetical protein